MVERGITGGATRRTTRRGRARKMRRSNLGNGCTSRTLGDFTDAAVPLRHRDLMGAAQREGVSQRFSVIRGIEVTRSDDEVEPVEKGHLVLLQSMISPGGRAGARTVFWWLSRRSLNQQRSIGSC